MPTFGSEEHLHPATKTRLSTTSRTGSANMLHGPSNVHGAPYQTHDRSDGRFSAIEANNAFWTQYHGIPHNQPRSTDVSGLPQQHLMNYPSHSGQMYNTAAFNMGQMANALPNMHGNMPHHLSSPQFVPAIYPGNFNGGYHQSMPYIAQPHSGLSSQHFYQNNSVMSGYSAYQTIPQSHPGALYSAPGHGFHSGYLVSEQMSAPSSQYSERALGVYGSGLPSIHPSQLLDTTFGPVSNQSLTDNVALASIPRGPPRKPRQSGHALWVGNLPLGARVIDLKDHFSKEATNDIESLKLISKSNCAFVNYRTQAACAAAMARFHDSRFHSTRLVCRLRRTSTANPPAMSTDSFPVSALPDSPGLHLDTSVQEETTTSGGAIDCDVIQVPAKYFVLKSLTLQDLEMSTRTRVWSTQAHNEDVLSQAYKTAENVYLIFSANKSGEYFGVARMLSTVLPGGSFEDSTPHTVRITTPTVFAKQPEMSPKSIPTPSTEWAPKGRIIDDSARGTIFWEADIGDETAIDENNDNSPSDSDSSTTVPNSGHKPVIARSPIERTASKPEVPLDDDDIKDTKGNSFRVEWISTKKVPFYRTRGLRNAWNANREVKIARDGTELETAVGKKLLALFGGFAA